MRILWNKMNKKKIQMNKIIRSVSIFFLMRKLLDSNNVIKACYLWHASDLRHERQFLHMVGFVRLTNVWCQDDQSNKPAFFSSQFLSVIYKLIASLKITRFLMFLVSNLYFQVVFWLLFFYYEKQEINL